MGALAAAHAGAGAAFVASSRHHAVAAGDEGVAVDDVVRRDGRNAEHDGEARRRLGVVAGRLLEGARDEEESLALEVDELGQRPPRLGERLVDDPEGAGPEERQAQLRRRQAPELFF